MTTTNPGVYSLNVVFGQRVDDLHTVFNRYVFVFPANSGYPKIYQNKTSASSSLLLLTESPIDPIWQFISGQELTIRSI